MNLDQLEQLARMAGYAAVPDEDESAEELARERRATLTQRLQSPDAPAPRPRQTALTVTTPVVETARTAVTSYVGGALRSAQGLIGVRGATA